MPEERSSDAQTGAPDTGGLAMDLAMEEARANPALQTHVAAFLEDQRGLIAVQKHHLIAQFALGQWEKRLGVFLRLATLVVGLGVAAALGAMVWQATHSKGLIVEPFTVPPDLAQRGLTGQTLASQVIGKLTAMTARESSRAVQSYANNWGDDAKVEIPETGVSIGELRRFLTDWLGNDIRISGEVYRTASGIAVTARAGGGDAGATFTGAEAELDTLLQKAAEHVYEVTQPYRYANYLDRNYDPVGLEDRVARATAIYRRLIAGNDPVERAWAWNGLGTIAFNFYSDQRQSVEYYRRAMATVPDFTLVYYALAARNAVLGQEEENLRNLREAVRLLDSNPRDLNPQYAATARLSAKGQAAALTGDYTTALPLFREGVELPDDFSVLSRGNYYLQIARAMSGSHDLSGLKRLLREINAAALSPTALTNIAAVAQDWREILRIEARHRDAIAQARNNRRVLTSRLGGYESLRPWYALAAARLGDFAAAERMVAPVAGDNEVGLRLRGTIASLQGQHDRADWWFARAVAAGPSIPFADLAWGQALLERKQYDAAIEKFTLANEKGPRFADPLQGWGEALMAKNQSHLALAKFAEAAEYAPNWGRLHLKWGQALAYTGRPDDAKAHFTRAATLDLTPSEKSELSKVTTK